MAMPAAAVTACCSAMPTSKNRFGKRSWKSSSPMGPAIAAVIATMRSSAAAMVSSELAKVSMKDWGAITSSLTRGGNL